MEGPRAPLENEWNDVIQFLNKNLRTENNWGIEQEYPTALNTTNRHNIRIIKNDHEIVSHAVLKPLIIKSPHIIYKLGAIGSVVTNENYRHQGHSSQILNECLQAAEEQSCDLAVLWTNLFDFYRQFGFELSGTEMSFVIPAEFEYQERPLQMSTSKAIAPEALLRVFNKHTVATVRTQEEIRKYQQIPQTEVYAAWELDGRLAAYAIMGKGVDLTGYVHEWGGDIEALLSLFSHVARIKNQSFVVIAPGHSLNLIDRLKKMSISSHQGYLGMLKILNFESLSAKIKRAYRQLGVSDFTLEKQGERYVFGFDKNLFNFNQLTDVQTLLFGPVNYRELDVFSEESLAKLEMLLPLPLWVWGWDSI